MSSKVAAFSLRNSVAITFIVAALCVAGAFTAFHMPSSVFPQTNFPRVIIMATDGVTPADEMTAEVTRPIEEAMKAIPGCETIRSSTARGSAEIDVFFSWDVDMKQSELYVLSHLAQIRQSLPPAASTDVYRMNFSVFPIIGISLTQPYPSSTDAWEHARYNIKPQILRIPGVARVDLVGGHTPEFSVTVDPLKLASLHMTLSNLVAELGRSNTIVPSGMMEESQSLFLTVVDGRVHSIEDISNLPLSTADGKLIPLSEIAKIDRGAEPVFQRVTADGADAVLINLFSQPDASTVDIATRLQQMMPEIQKQLPAGMKLAFFYDQSTFVRASTRSVWDAIAFGLILSISIVFLFLSDGTMTFVAVLVIPITVLVTILAMYVLGQSFNLMTLGGIAAAIGLIIDDAIVVVEAIAVEQSAGLGRAQVVHNAIAGVLSPLLGSTLTPVVVFIPLAFLVGIAGVFFRALALTMVISLLASLVLAITVTPAMSAWLVRPRKQPGPGMFFSWIMQIYESILRIALANRWFVCGICCIVLLTTVVLYGKLKTDFLPKMDEGGFIIDYVAPPGISLDESDRELRQAEAILKTIPEIEHWSRRTGTALGVALVEPNTGDFLVKLKPDRSRSTADVIADVRAKFRASLPRIEWEYPGILTDLIGDLTWSDEAIEVKYYSTDEVELRAKAHAIQDKLDLIPGVVDSSSGIIVSGPTIRLKVRPEDASLYGLSTASIGNEVNIAMLGQIASSVLEGDRTVNIRVKDDPAAVSAVEPLGQLPIRAADGTIIRLDQVAEIQTKPGELELHRDNLRENISATANLQNRDLGGAMADVRNLIASDPALASLPIEYGGLFEQQRESFRNLAIVLATALALVFIVALVEFRGLLEPIAIVSGAALASLGVVLALLITGTTVNIIAILGAVIGMGIVHKNGLLMLDAARNFMEDGVPIADALILAGRRRLRPVLMTSLAAGLGMLPLALGFGAADMLRPMAVTVIGAVCISVLLSLVATPTIYYVLRKPVKRVGGSASSPQASDAAKS